MNNTATQPNLLELAKQGNAQAIATLMNRQLQPKGITVKAALKDGCLQIMLESAQVPNQQALVEFIRKGITSLGAESIKSVKIYGRKTGGEFPSWSQEIELGTQAALTSSKTEVVTFHTNAPLAQPVVQTSALTKDNRTRLTDNKTAQKTPKNFKIKALLAVAGLVVLGSVGLISWLRFTQEQSLAKAQTLVASAEKASGASDLDSLKTAQKQLKEAANEIEKNNNIPGLSSSKARSELATIRTRLNALEPSLKMAENLERIRPEARAAVEKFAAINSRLDVGMNYRDYSSHVGELKVALDRFSQQPGATNLPIYETLKNAFKEYNFALEVWRYYIESDERNSFFPASSEYGSALIQNYQVTIENIVGQEYIYLNTALAAVWGRANNYVKESQGQI